MGTMSTDVSACALGELSFEDFKSVVQYTNCGFYFRSKCVNMDLRGFYMKKSTWKYRKCTGESAEA